MYSLICFLFYREMTGNIVSVSHIFKLRRSVVAQPLFEISASSRKAAALGNVYSIGYISLKENMLLLSKGVLLWLCGDQRFGIGVHNMGIYLVNRTHFHYRSQIHHRKLITDMLYHITGSLDEISSLTF